MSDNGMKLKQLSRYVTVQEVAAKLRMGVSTVYRKIADGLIPGSRPFGGTAVRIPRDWFEEHCKEIDQAAMDEMTIDPDISRAA